MREVVYLMALSRLVFPAELGPIIKRFWPDFTYMEGVYM